MTTAHTFLHRPQQLPARKWLFQIHLWAGVIAGLYIFIIGVTGSAIVFREEIELAQYAEIQRVEDAVAPQASLQQVADAVRRAHPRWSLYGLYPPAGGRNTFMAYINRGQEFQGVFVHPRTATVLGVIDPKKSFLRWIEDLHINLLAGRVGRIVNGVGALCLLLLCVTGMVVWWPGKRRWKSALTVDFKRKWKRINWDMHSAVGFWTTGVLLLWGVSGAYFCFPPIFTAAVNWISPVSFRSLPKSTLPSAPHEQRASFETVVRSAKEKSPGQLVIGVIHPAGPRSVFTVMLSRDRTAEFATADYFYFDQYSGNLLQVWHRGVSKTAGDLIINWMAPLHFGTFGSLPIKILWVFLGLSLPVLFVTGAIMWWNRVLHRKYRQLKHHVRTPSLSSSTAGMNSKQEHQLRRS